MWKNSYWPHLTPLQQSYNLTDAFSASPAPYIWMEKLITYKPEYTALYRIWTFHDKWQVAYQHVYHEIAHRSMYFHYFSTSGKQIRFSSKHVLSRRTHECRSKASPPIHCRHYWSEQPLISSVYGEVLSRAGKRETTAFSVGLSAFVHLRQSHSKSNAPLATSVNSATVIPIFCTSKINPRNV